MAVAADIDMTVDMAAVETEMDSVGWDCKQLTAAVVDDVAGLDFALEVVVVVAVAVDSRVAAEAVEVDGIDLDSAL